MKDDALMAVESDEYDGERSESQWPSAPRDAAANQQAAPCP